VDNLLWPLLVAQTEEMKTIPLYIVRFTAEKHTDEGAMMAVAAIASIPILILFSSYQSPLWAAQWCLRVKRDMRVTLYIFDLGGVVVRITMYFRRTQLPQYHLGRILTFAGENLKKLFNGKVSPDEFWVQFSSRYGREVKEELFGKFYHPSIDQEVIALIRQLKARARVVCGTNTFDPHTITI